MALFEAVYGRRPAATVLDLMSGEVEGPVVPADRRAPRWLRQVLERGLSLRPRDRFPSMATLLVALREIPGRRRRVLLALAGSFALMAAVVVGAALGPEPGSQVCADPEERMAQIWGPTQRRAIAAAFTATGLSYARGAQERVAGEIDRHARRWIGVRRFVCESGAPGQERSDARVRCLEQVRDSLARRIEVLASADAATVGEAEALIAALPDPGRCRDAAAPPAEDPPGPDALELLARGRDAGDASELRGLLERARMFMQTRQGREAAALLEPASVRLRASGDRSGEAEALLLLGKVRGRLLRDPARAKQSLDDAYNAAARARRRELMWDIWNEQASLQALEFDDPVEARRLWGYAVSESEASEEIDAALMSVEAEILRAEGEGDAAVKRGRELLAALDRRELPADHPERTAAQEALGVSLAEAERHEESLALHRRLLAETSKHHGGEHPATARIELNLGRDHFELEEWGPARRHVEHARDVLLATYGASHVRVAAADLVLAQLDEQEGAFDRAIDRSRAALRIYDENYPRAYGDRIGALILLARLYTTKTATARLLEVSRELLALHDERLTAMELDVPGQLANIGDSLCVLGRCAEALEYFNRLQGATNEPGMLAFALQGRGQAQLVRGEPEEALFSFQEALRIYEAQPHDRGGITANLIATMRLTADTLASLGRAPRRVRALRERATRLAAESAQE